MYFKFCQFRKREMVQSWFQKLFWNQDCCVESNLHMEIAIYNFDLFQCHGEEISMKEEQGLEEASDNYLPSQNIGITPIFFLQNCILNHKPTI